MTNGEINEAVARKLGWIKPTREFEPWKRGQYEMRTSYEIPAYSTSIEAAWEIVEHLAKKDAYLELKTFPIGREVICTIGFYDREPDILAEADTAPMAICLAFLKLP